MYKAPVGKTFELYDINQDVTPANLRHKVTENVEFLLKREKLLPNRHSVVIPVGGDNWETDDDGSYTYNGNFEIFAPDLDTIVAYGEVYGRGIWFNGEKGSLTEIELEITELTGNAPGTRVKLKKSKPRRKAHSVSSLRGLR